MKSAEHSHKRLLDALLSRKQDRIQTEVIEHLTPDVVIPASIAE